LIRRALATAEHASRYSNHIDHHCAYCGAVETDFHLFFQCSLARAVRFSASPPLRTDTLPPEDDGIQITLSCLITPSTSDDILCSTLTTMWYIWKARNDNRFQRKTWNPWQVHHQATAHLHTHKLIQLEGLQQDQQEVPNLLATTTSSRRQHHSQQTQGIESPNAYTSTHQVDRYTIWVPALLPGVRCFVDASALPDQPSQHARRAGIGILFVNT
jgi:hypothetical protein